MRLPKGVAREDVQIPDSEADAHAIGSSFQVIAASGHCNGAAELEVAEVRRRFGAEAHADEFDFGDDEAVAAVVLAHQALQVGKVLQVFNAFLAEFSAFSGVPAFEGHDEADDPATA